MIDEPDIREQLAALLAGDLDEPAAGALQARIDAEPWVGRLADEMADLLVQLGRVDEVVPRDGFAERLRAGLEAEIGHPLTELPPLDVPDQRVLVSAGAAAATGWGDRGPARRADAARPQANTGRGRPRARTRGFLGVAAVLVVLAVAGVGVLTQGGGSDTSADFAANDAGDTAGDDTAAGDVAASVQEGDGADAPTAAEAPAAAADAPGPAEDEAREDAAEGATEAAADEGLLLATPEVATSAAAAGPTTVTLEALDGSDQGIADALADQPATQALLGTPAADAIELAAAYRDELLRGSAFPDGTEAGACLVATLDAAGADLVPAVAARIDLPAGPVVAYALVRAGAGDVLDTVDVWVLTLPGCAVDRVVQTR